MGLGEILEAATIKHKKTKIKGQLRKYKQNTRMMSNQKKPPLEDDSLIPLPKNNKDPGFKKFCRWYSYPRYRGAYAWQLESHNKLWPSTYSMELVHRDAGKSIKYAAEYQWAIQFKETDVLLLGWTARRKEVAAFVYAFFNQYDLIERDKRTSPFHFKTKGGGKFDCYLITGKETLGMHSVGKQERFIDLTQPEMDELRDLLGQHRLTGTLTDKELGDFLKYREGSERRLWISIDDPIDITFMKERYREKELELRFDTTLYSINPDKWSFTGTHKFKGDIFDFWRNKFKKELVTYTQGPYRKNGSILCPEKFTDPNQPNYKSDILKFKVDKNLKPILEYDKDKSGNIIKGSGKKIPKTPKKCLDKLRRHMTPYVWASEWEQNPNPVKSEVWDHIEEELMLASPIGLKHDLLIFTIDRATTLKETSDYTGCVLEMREIGTGNRVIFEDWTDNISFDKLLIEINDYIIRFRGGYEHIDILIIIETQGGGDDFVTMAKNTVAFTRPNPNTGVMETVRNQIPEIAIIIEVHNMGEKINRIRERCNPGILNGKLRILKSLRGSEAWDQIVYYPNTAYLDAIDAIANSEHIILTKYPVVKEGRYKDINKVYDDYEKGVYKEEAEEDYEAKLSMGGGSKLPQWKRRTVF